MSIGRTLAAVAEVVDSADSAASANAPHAVKVAAALGVAA